MHAAARKSKIRKNANNKIGYDRVTESQMQ